MKIRLPSLDYSKVARSIGSFIASFVRESGRRGVVIGLSGGLDSSVAAKLCAEALGPEKVRALIMPDAEVTPREDVEDALELARILSVKAEVVDITRAVRAIVESYPLEGGDVVAVGNVRARVRMVLLYYVANSLGLLVAGAGDRSEVLLGYFTKYGDGGADFLPIGNLYKTQVRELGKHLGLPLRIVEKPSSPRLWRGQTAEGELGLSYEVIDPILHGLYDLGLSEGEVAEGVGVGIEDVKRVKSLVEGSRHKRVLPPAAPVLA
ncbi:MAG: NAD+ synthase [Candidatus Nezhaarchaeota archaeon]|nr:NAD+ synthase [Candidatus Nezhaarchaeota archaeon]